MRKNKYNKGDIVLTEDAEDVVKIIDLKPCKMSVHSKHNDGWEYKVRVDGTTLWINEYDIIDRQKYQPVTLTPARHIELCQELNDYERFRDFLEDLKPKNGFDRLTVRLMKELLENLALTIEGTSKEIYKAQAEIESLMR